ncbi:MAG: bifunctional UDP-N-acetylmuramoyl-tripeptide:D-alanyl-D-alanine ligase/alanine racemase [Salibacteraceae bacterium]
MNYAIESIAHLSGGRLQSAFPGSVVTDIVIDHREATQKGVLFTAIRGARTDGHAFIGQLIENGVRHFMVTEPNVAELFEGRANFIVVENAVVALQAIAKYHRLSFSIPVIGITGSNGKTIVKEWLNTLLETSYKICRSPKSFNSQIGVPLSLFRLNRNHTLAIIEAGISKPGEMKNLEEMIKPVFGVFTNLGEAHAAHFESDRHKLMEKLLLFRDAKKVVCCADSTWYEEVKAALHEKVFSWSLKDRSADLWIETIATNRSSSYYKLWFGGKDLHLELPFTDRISIENALTCAATLAMMGRFEDDLFDRFRMLAPVAMRMELKQGIENSLVIDDCYNADIDSLKAALERLSAQPNRKRIVILSDIKEASSTAGLYERIAEMIRNVDVKKLIAIGPELKKHSFAFKGIDTEYFNDAESYWKKVDSSFFRDSVVLVKGARRFKLEKLVKQMLARQHMTRLEIDLHKLGENLRFFRKKVSSDTAVMAMVKAFGYGSGSFEIAHFLQELKVDYLGVAFADEGVELRKQGIKLPIMVMSPEEAAYENLIKHGLEPEIYSLRSLNSFIEAARAQRHLFDVINIHVKIDTGMHRLGFETSELETLAGILKEHKFISVKSIFSHLAASDLPDRDEFTRLQVNRFEEASQKLEKALGYKVLRHILNSNGILRFPEYQYDMVRLGIGLYGFVSTADRKYLHAAGKLVSYIVQIREVKAGETVGYGNPEPLARDARIGIAAIGYADGLDRRLGDGKWSLRWQAKPCPIVGSICMDMCMIDLTDTTAAEGDEVVVFEGREDVEKLSELLATSPYEILTGISQRIRRVYLKE